MKYIMILVIVYVHILGVDSHLCIMIISILRREEESEWCEVRNPEELWKLFGGEREREREEKGGGGGIEWGLIDAVGWLKTLQSLEFIAETRILAE